MSSRVSTTTTTTTTITTTSSSGEQMRMALKPDQIIVVPYTNQRFQIKVLIGSTDKTQVFTATSGIGAAGTDSVLLKRVMPTSRSSVSPLEQVKFEVALSRIIDARSEKLFCELNGVCSLAFFSIVGGPTSGAWIVFPFQNTQALSDYAQNTIWPRGRQALKDGKQREQSIELLSYAQQLFDALAMLHAIDVVHMDLKPENAVIEVDTKRLRLIDFGISCTRPSSVFGTVRTAPMRESDTVCPRKYDTTANWKDPLSATTSAPSEIVERTALFKKFDIFQAAGIVTYLSDYNWPERQPRQQRLPSYRFVRATLTKGLEMPVFKLLSEMTGPLRNRRPIAEYALLVLIVARQLK